MYDETEDETLELSQDTLTPAPLGEPELPAPSDFNLDAWINGVQPTLRSCNIYQRSDLLARIEELESRLKIAQAAAKEESLEDTADDPAVLDAELARVYQEFVDSGITFRVQGMSRAANDRIKDGVLRHRMSNGLSKAEKNELVTRHQLAAAIVKPEGITPEHLEILNESTGAQYRRLVATFIAACVQAPQPSVPSSPAR